METSTCIWVALAFSAFFSGMESAFISSSKLRYELDKKEHGVSSRILGIFYRHPNRFVSTMAIGNMIALIVFASRMVVFSRPFVADVVANDALVLFIQCLISVVIILLLGEFIPKTIFKLNPNLTLHLFALPSFVVYVLLAPISMVADLVVFILLRLGGVKRMEPSSNTFGKMDLDYFIQRSLEEAPTDSEMDTEVKIFQNALDFSNVRLRDCIVPRTEIVACDMATTMEELRSKFIESGFSKILVFNENIDDIVGYIHSSELFKNPDDWTRQIRPVSIVPETMAANKLMKLLMQEKRSLAVVVDEFGGTSGIVTLEDLVEEIFGEIEDEHDTKSYVARKVADNEFVLSGRIEIDTLNEMFHLDLPESDDYVTIAGFILHFYQRFPKLNETIQIDKYSFKVIKVTSTKIELVRMKVGN